MQERRVDAAGNAHDLAINISGPHGPCGAGAVRATMSLTPLPYITKYCFKYVLNCPDISLTGPGITAVAAPGLLGTQALEAELQYSYLRRSGTPAGRTRDTYAEPPRPDGVPNE